MSAPSMGRAAMVGAPIGGPKWSGNPKWAGNPNWSGKIHDHRFHRFHRNVFFVGGFAGPYYDYGYACWQWVPTRWGTWTRIWVYDYPNPYGY